MFQRRIILEEGFTDMWSNILIHTQTVCLDEIKMIGIDNVVLIEC